LGLSEATGGEGGVKKKKDNPNPTGDERPFPVTGKTVGK